MVKADELVYIQLELLELSTLGIVQYISQWYSQLLYHLIVIGHTLFNL